MSYADLYGKSLSLSYLEVNGVPVSGGGGGVIDSILGVAPGSVATTASNVGIKVYGGSDVLTNVSTIFIPSGGGGGSGTGISTITGTGGGSVPANGTTLSMFWNPTYGFSNVLTTASNIQIPQPYYYQFIGDDGASVNTNVLASTINVVVGSIGQTDVITTGTQISLPHPAGSGYLTSLLGAEAGSVSTTATLLNISTSGAYSNVFTTADTILIPNVGGGGGGITELSTINGNAVTTTITFESATESVALSGSSNAIQFESAVLASGTKLWATTGTTDTTTPASGTGALSDAVKAYLVSNGASCSFITAWNDSATGQILSGNPLSNGTTQLAVTAGGSVNSNTPYSWALLKPWGLSP